MWDKFKAQEEARLRMFEQFRRFVHADDNDLADRELGEKVYARWLAHWSVPILDPNE